MKAVLRKFRNFIDQHIWADFLFTFISYGIILSTFQSSFYENGKGYWYFILNVAVYAVVMTMVMRLIRKTNKPHPLELGDDVIYFKKGQRSQLKEHLESIGYSFTYNNGRATYFDPHTKLPNPTPKTFIYETDQWTALIASKNTRSSVPNNIIKL